MKMLTQMKMLTMSVGTSALLIFASLSVCPPPSSSVSFLRSGESERVWILDPIDGTKGFMTGKNYIVGLALCTGKASQKDNLCLTRTLVF